MIKRDHHEDVQAERSIILDVQVCSLSTTFCSKTHRSRQTQSVSQVRLIKSWSHLNGTIWNIKNWVVTSLEIRARDKVTDILQSVTKQKARREDTNTKHLLWNIKIYLHYYKTFIYFIYMIKDTVTKILFLADAVTNISREVINKPE